MASGGKRGSAGERVLEGRHVIGLFMLMLLFSALFFTLGFVMGRNQYDGQVRAANSLNEVRDTDVLPRPEAATKATKKKPSADARPDATTADTQWEFYHAVDSNKTDDGLKPVSTTPSPVVGKNSVSNKPTNESSKTGSNNSIRANGGINLQVAAFTKKIDALGLANTLHKKNFPTFVQTPQGDKYYHVLVGPYADQKAVDNARKGLEAAGFKAIVKH